MATSRSSSSLLAGTKEKRRFPALFLAVSYRLSGESRANDSDLILGTPVGEIPIHSQLVGRPNAYNIMAAAGAAISLGFSQAQIQTGIEALEGVPGRMEHVKGGQDFQVIVDYAHTPDGLKNALQAVREHCQGRLWCVVGCGC